MPEDKLAGYALDPAHPRGRHKTRVFSSALGIEQEDWRYLRDQLAEGIVGAPVEGMRITPFGVLYEAVVLVDGLNGTTVPVATIWRLRVDTEGAGVGGEENDALRHVDENRKAVSVPRARRGHGRASGMVGVADLGVLDALRVDRGGPRSVWPS